MLSDTTSENTVSIPNFTWTCLHMCRRCLLFGELLWPQAKEKANHRNGESAGRRGRRTRGREVEGPGGLALTSRPGKKTSRC